MFCMFSAKKSEENELVMCPSVKQFPVRHEPAYVSLPSLLHLFGFPPIGCADTVQTLIYFINFRDFFFSYVKIDLRFFIQGPGGVSSCKTLMWVLSYEYIF